MEQIQKLIEKWEKERESTIDYITDKTKPNSKERYMLISKETTLSDCIQDLKKLNGDTEKRTSKLFCSNKYWCCDCIKNNECKRNEHCDYQTKNNLTP